MIKSESLALSSSTCEEGLVKQIRFSLWFVKERIQLLGAKRLFHSALILFLNFQLGNYNPSPQLVPTPAPTYAPGQTPTPSTGESMVIYPSGTQPIIGGGTTYPGGGYALPAGATSGSTRSKYSRRSKICKVCAFYNS